MERILNAITRRARYILQFGAVKGLKLHRQMRIGRGTFEVNFPGFPHPLYLRKETRDPVVFNIVLLDGEYQCEAYTDTPKVIVDCGANIGMTSLFFANKYPDAQILSIEPNEGNFAMLERNCDPYENIEVLRGAVWPEPSELFISNPDDGETLFIVKEGNGTVSSSLPAVTMTEILDRVGGSIDLLKIDIEGAERDLFLAEDLSWMDHVRAIAIETHDQFASGSSQALNRAVDRWTYDQFMHGPTTYIVKRDSNTVPSTH